MACAWNPDLNGDSKVLASLARNIFGRIDSQIGPEAVRVIGERLLIVQFMIRFPAVGESLIGHCV